MHISQFRTGLLMAILALMLIPGAALAQWNFHLNAGLTGSTLRGTNTEFSSVIRFAGGLGVSYDISNRLFFRGDVLYVVKGAKADLIFDSVAGEFSTDRCAGSTEADCVPFDARLDLPYLDLPVVLGLRLGSGGSFQPVLFAGPALALKMGAAEITTLGPGETDPSVDEDRSLKSLDFGVAFGAGADFDIGGERFMAGIRATIGLSNIRTSTSELNNSQALVYLGVTL